MHDSNNDERAGGRSRPNFFFFVLKEMLATPMIKARTTI
jgi:hypothetical protein